MKSSDVVSVGLRWGVAMIFLVSCIDKIDHPDRFLSAVYAYEMLGERTGLLVASVLPWVELVLATTMFVGVYVNGSFFVSLLLLLTFVGAQLFAIQRGLEISCSCFTLTKGANLTSPDMISYGTASRTAFFAIMAGVGFIRHFRSGDRGGIPNRKGRR